MGNLPSNPFCPVKERRPYSVKPLLDPHGHGVCPTVPVGMSQRVLNMASQHGSSPNIEPLPVRPATFTTQHFAPVSSLPVRHW